ncbi:GatB/YqeY domain-containing protein [Thiofaba sp. EF100]|uniref:GatB/YqeY domain-containing protein n=1 Tax=Thiofaba sp. EF100 TaxID=3121274 RepID=UPI0032220963
MSEASSALKARILDDMKAAMKAGDKSRLAVIRLISAALKQKEVDERITLSDADVIAVLDKMGKQRRESIEQYKAAGRADLAEQEGFELEVIQSYLPAPLSDAEIDALIAEAVAATGATSVREMGAVMGKLRPQIQGRADMTQVSARIKSALGG